jgi:hypothetical protein
VWHKGKKEIKGAVKIREYLELVELVECHAF